MAAILSRPQYAIYQPILAALYCSEIIFNGISFECINIVGWIYHDDVIKWKHFPRYWPFVRGIHRSPVNSPHKGQWREVLMFSLVCVWINGWVNNREAGDLRRYRAHCDVTLMTKLIIKNILRVKCTIHLHWSITPFKTNILDRHFILDAYRAICLCVRF